MPLTGLHAESRGLITLENVLLDAFAPPLPSVSALAQRLNAKDALIG